ncbi:MAG: hypothetical protein ACR2JM_02395 [Mycobacterium sp.]
MNLDKINLGPGSGVRAVKVEENYSIIGNIDDQLAPATPIAFLAPTAANTANLKAGAPKAGTTSGFDWWTLLPVVALVGAIGGLTRLFGTRAR